MEEQNAGLFMCHVRMDCDDVDAACPNCFERGLQLIFGHREISIDNGVVIVAGKRRPCVYPHGVVDLDAMHRRRMTDGEFQHATVQFATNPENLVERLGRNRICFRQRSSAEGICRPRIAARTSLILS